MARKFGNGIDLQQTQLLNVQLQNLASTPGSPIGGQFWWNSTTNRPFFWNAADGAAEMYATNSDLLQGLNGAYYLALGNATGTLPAAQLPAFTGDITTSAGSSTATISAGAVSLAKQAQLAPNSIQGNNTGSAATPMALTVAQTKALLAIAVTDVSGAEATANKGAANGYAGLDATGKVPTTQLPAAVLGAVNYQGIWNASTNSPALVSGTGTKGYFYKVSVAGATGVDGIASWNVGDSIVFDGTTWDKIDGITSEMISVAGRTGVVTLSSADIAGLVASATTDTTNASNITSGTLAAARLPTTIVNKYETDIGDGATTSIVVNHSLGTRAVKACIYSNTSPYAEIDTDIQHTSTGSLTLIFAAAPSAAQYHCVVQG